MGEMRCDQCKFWHPDDQWEYQGAGFGLCKAVRERWEIMDEASDKRSEKHHIQARVDALKAARACVQDGSEYRAELLTGPDFFCALFSAAAVKAGDGA